MKKCSRCGETKSLDQFHKAGGTKLAAFCIPCHKLYTQQHYKENKASYTLRDTARRSTLIAALNVLKERPCTDCKRVYPPYVMEFDHRDPSTKIACVTSVACTTRNIDKTFEELRKCDVVCANCHMIRTFKRKEVE